MRFWDYVNLFEFKTPLKQADRAMLLIADCGGGGTPTAEAVTHAARMLRLSAAEHKLVVVVTDAPANDTAHCAQAARAATSEGVRVMVFVPELVEWMRNGGEAQYEPTPTSAAGRQRRPAGRGADRPEWMDRVPPRAPA